MKKKSVSLNLLKFLTMLLIINSHADVLYPDRISFLASGGGIGNELFFLISGYLFSAKNDITKDIKRRFVRLYMPAYIMIGVTALFGRIQIDSLVKKVKVFFWPTQFWFVGAIFIYSIILYLLIKIGIEKKRVFLCFVGILITVDIFLYIFAISDKSKWIVEDSYLLFIPFRSIYSIFSFIFGYYLKKNYTMIDRINEKLAVFLAISLFMVFYGFKFLLNEGIVPMSLQIVSQPLTVLSAAFIFLSFVKVDLNPELEEKIIANWINGLSSLSLESYLVQFLVIEGVALLKLPFPVSLIICFVLVILAAISLKKIVDELMISFGGKVK